MIASEIAIFISKNIAENIAVIFKNASVITGKNLRQSLVENEELNLWHLEGENGINFIIVGDEIASLLTI